MWVTNFTAQNLPQIIINQTEKMAFVDCRESNTVQLVIRIFLFYLCCKLISHGCWRNGSLFTCIYHFHSHARFFFIEIVKISIGGFRFQPQLFNIKKKTKNNVEKRKGIIKKNTLTIVSNSKDMSK